MTQGLITITEDGNVIMKIVAGSNGMIAEKVAKSLVKIYKRAKLSEVYEMVLDIGFGSQNDLVVINENEQFSKSPDVISPLYRKTFTQPEFNPRWECGLADYVKVVHV